MTTRDTIIKTLAQAREKLLARYQSFTPEELECICTQSETPGGEPWRPKDHLAHLALIEHSFRGMVRRAIKGSADPVGFSRTGATNREEILAWIHHNNQVYVDAHRNDDVETLLAELTSAREETLGLLEQLTNEQLAIALPGAPWADGTAGGILITNAQHEYLHLSWVEEGLHQRS